MTALTQQVDVVRLQWDARLAVSVSTDVLEQACQRAGAAARVVSVQAQHALVTGMDVDRLREALSMVRQQWLAGAHGLSISLMRLRGRADTGPVTSSMTQSWHTCLAHADAAGCLMTCLGDVLGTEGRDGSGRLAGRDTSPLVAVSSAAPGPTRHDALTSRPAASGVQ